VDRLRVPLSRDALGLLGSEATFPHPRGEIPRMETDGELLWDQMGQPRAGPKLGGEPMLRGFLRQPTQDDFLLGGCELSRSSRGRTSDQSLFPVPVKGSHPPPHGGSIDPQEIGHLLGRVPFQDALDGESPPMFQFNG